jgi:hypothetical protein
VFGNSPSFWIESDINKPTQVVEENYLLTPTMIATNDLNGYMLKDDSIALTTRIEPINSGQKGGTTFISSLDPDIESALVAVQDVLAPNNNNSVPTVPEVLTPEPIRPYIPPRLLIDIPGLEPNEETFLIDVFSDFVLPSGIVVYESTGKPFILQNIEIFGEVDVNQLGTYRITYLYRHFDRGVIRRINFRVVDRVAPEAT